MSCIKMNCLTLASIVLMSNAAFAADVQWLGGSADVSLGSNWSNGVGPGMGDRAMIGSSPNAPDLAGSTVNWGQLYMNVSNDVADSGGGGVINLTGPNFQIFTEGAESSTIAPAVAATGVIQTNGQHSVTFNGSLTANKLEAFGGSVLTLNGITTQNESFMSIGGGSKIVINNEFHWNRTSDFGINNSPVLEFDAGAKLFRSDGAGGWTPGLDVFNVFDGATVRILADQAFGGGETDLWTRNTTNTFDLNGFNQNVEFFGMGDAPAALNIDFGAASGANKLVWDASHGMNSTGLYNVVNFEPGADTLEFGQYGDDGGFMNPLKLGRITLNGASYSASSPGPGMAWWNAIPTPDPNDDGGRQIAVYHAAVPEPATLMLLGLALVGIGSQGRARIFR